MTLPAVRELMRILSARSEPEQARRRIALVWRVGVVTGLLACVVTIAWGVYLVDATFRGLSTEEARSRSLAPALDRGALRSALDTIEAREVAAGVIRARASFPADPSR